LPSLRYAIATVLAGTSLHAGTASAQLEEIIVTATFRETNVQDTPIAITAVNAAMLEGRGQTNILDVANQAPNVTMTPAGQGAGSAMITFIRGIGQTDFNYALEPGVGMYVDEIYYPNLTGSMVELLDIDRVEIARGPQGTLAGRNSIGGSVKIYSVEPTHGSNSGTAELSVGNFDQIAFKGAADLTFVEDKLSARISGVSSSRNGYVHASLLHTLLAGSTFQNGRLDNCKLGDLGGESFWAAASRCSGRRGHGSRQGAQRPHQQDNESALSCSLASGLATSPGDRQRASSTPPAVSSRARSSTSTATWRQRPIACT
jgi:iron complex outermembrane receptor protein